MSKRPTDPAERFLWRAQHVRALCDGLAADAEELTSSTDGAAFAAPATYAFALSALLEATIRTRQALPAAFLAMVVGRLWHKHKGLPAAEATALLARMMAGEDQRDVMVNLATAAIDDWLDPHGIDATAEVYDWHEAGEGEALPSAESTGSVHGKVAEAVRHRLSEIGIEAHVLPDGPDLGERIGGFEPPTGDEIDLLPLIEGVEQS